MTTKRTSMIPARHRRREDDLDAQRTGPDDELLEVGAAAKAEGATPSEPDDVVQRSG
jgi:hypothetical protein